ncbi:MAG: PilW family protein [Pseudomonadota bacterium]
MNVRHHSKQSGYTLIELLIALTIGAFLIGGILQLYVGSKKSYTTQQSLTELQEVGRFSLNMMVRDIRLAGFMGCGNAATVINTLNNGALNWEYDAATSIVGYEAGTAFPADFSGLALAGTDALTITRAIPEDRYVVQSHSPATATITLDAAHDIQAGEVLAITDCLNTAIFQQTNANAGNTATTILNASGAGSPGNCTQGLGEPLDCSTATGTPYQYDEDSFVLRLMSRAYYVGTGASGRSALFRMTLGANGSLGVPVEIADGVVDMQLVYGVDSDFDGSIDAYQRADAISTANWANVLSVQINLLMESTDDRVADNPQSYILFDGTAASLAPVTPADRRLRRVYSSTTTIRNRVL